MFAWKMAVKMERKLTSAKDGMFYVAFVRLSVSGITQKGVDKF